MPELKALKVRFTGSLVARHAEMADALMRSDLATVAGIAHQLKGSGGNFGFPDLTVCAGTLEHLARSGDAQNSARALAELAALIRAITENTDNTSGEATS